MTESTEKKRVWHSGPPPHVGWWQASVGDYEDAWRWWNGVHWSSSSYPWEEASYASRKATVRTKSRYINWNDYYPKNARVPRIKP